MPAREIPRNEWIDFTSRFGSDYRGRPITIQVFYFDGGPKFVARTLPLRDISADPNGNGSISITAGQGWDEHVMHRVDAPSEFSVEETRGQTDAELRIRFRDGTMTLVYVDPAQ